MALVEKIRMSRAALEGERKHVTVLFADLKDSLELIRDLDPEAAQQLLDPALHAMMDAVHRYEGTVNQVQGDGLMAIFGAPIAHEDHALRACYAALAMQAVLRTYAEEVRRTHGPALQSRIGLNSGEVVVVPFTTTCIWITPLWGRRRTWHAHGAISPPRDYSAHGCHHAIGRRVGAGQGLRASPHPRPGIASGGI